MYVSRVASNVKLKHERLNNVYFAGKKQQIIPERLMQFPLWCVFFAAPCIINSRGVQGLWNMWTRWHAYS